MDLFARLATSPTPPAPAPRAAVADHHCAVCGIWAGFGFGVSLRHGRPGRWACFAHRAQVERMAA